MTHLSSASSSEQPEPRVGGDKPPAVIVLSAPRSTTAWSGLAGQQEESLGWCYGLGCDKIALIIRFVLLAGMKRLVVSKVCGIKSVKLNSYVHLKIPCVLS